MSTPSVLWLTVSVLLGAVILALVFVVVRRRQDPQSCCYRCGTIPRTEFMGLPYCWICRDVVASIYPAVAHDPPYGFPGAAGTVVRPADAPGDVDEKEENR
jgi:hypothetical protein